MQADPFHNTINLTGAALDDAERKAMGLQRIILKIFEANPGVNISGWQMKHYLDTTYNKKHNLLSVRRSMSNLKNDEELVKLKLQRTGDEGSPEHFYVLNNGEYDVEKAVDNVKDTAYFANKIIEHSVNKSYVQPALFKDDEKENTQAGGKVDK